MSTPKPLKIRLGRRRRYETPMIEWYWHGVGGTLCADFPVSSARHRELDAVILPDEKYREIDTNEMSKLLDGRDVIVVQAKANRLGMPLMGQTLFSPALVKREFNAGSIRSIALCKEDDDNIRSLLNTAPLRSFTKETEIDNIEVVEVPKDFEERRWYRRGKDERSMICRYWNQTKRKGKLFDNFQLVDDNSTSNPQVFGALLLTDEPTEWTRWSDISASDRTDIYAFLHKHHVTIVHAEKKLAHIGMSLMGEALFSAMLVKQRFRPHSICSVALCEEDDDILHPLLVSVGKKVGINMEVREIPRS